MNEFKLAIENAPGPDQVIQLSIDGRAPIALYNLDGDYFATDDTCTHGDASLAEGDIEGAEIICPFHLGAFDIRTGEVTAAPCSQAIQIYPVARCGDDLVINLANSD